MSSNYVDERVVQMKFDNNNFEKNVHESMSTIDKLKQKLNFRGAVQGMDELGTATKELGSNTSVLTSAIGAATNKFSALEIAGITAISRITNKVIDLGVNLVKSLSVDQLASGWDKYEEKITAVQTIMSATASNWEENAKRIGFAGTQMEYVNGQLDKLNWFSDETSYSFTDMTSNIGKFTSAGVALDQAVTAMEGISVWAAKSGQNAQSASRAYYNLAQAISVGSVKLIDWKSIENANMATMEFKQTAIDTAVSLGTLKKQSDGTFKTLKGHTVTVQDFNQQLSDAWFNSDVLMKTLEEYGKAATRLSEIYENYGIYATEFLGGLEDWTEGNADINDIAEELGVNVATLLPLFKELSSAEYKLSLSAFKAAQEAKTFSEVIAATKDAVSTQWMNTFELIFGNYEETKRLWSDMAESFYEIFAEGGSSRNNMLKRVLGDPWDNLIKQINDAGISTKYFESVLTDNLRKAGIPIDEMLEQWGSLSEVFKNNTFLIKYIKDTILNLIHPVTEGGQAISEVTDKLEDFQNVVNNVIRGNYGNGQDRIKRLTDAGYEYATVQGLVNKVWEKNNHTWKDTTITVDDLIDVLGEMSKEELESLDITEEQVEALQALKAEAAESGSELDELLKRLEKPTGRQLIFNSLLNVVEAFKVALQAIKDAWQMAFPPKGDSFIYKLLEGFHAFTKWLIMSKETAARVSKALSGLFNILGIIVDTITTIIKTLFPGFRKGAGTLADSALTFLEHFADATAKFREFLKTSNIVKDAVELIIKFINKAKYTIISWIESIRNLPIIGTIFTKVSEKIKAIIDFIKGLFETSFDDIVNDTNGLKNKLEDAFNKIKSKISELVSSVPLFKKLKDAFGKILEVMQKVGGYFSEGFFVGIKQIGSLLIKKVADLVTKIKNKVWELLDINSPSGWAIDTVWWIAKGVAQGIIQVANYIIEKVRSFVRGIMGVSETIVEEIPDAINDSANANKNEVADAFKKIFETSKEFLTAFIQWVKDGVVNIIDYVKGIPFDKLAEILITVLDIVKTIALIKMYSNIGSAFKNLSDAFENISDSIENLTKARKYKALGKLALAMAIAIGIIVAAIVVLSKYSGEELTQASEIILSTLVVIGLVLAVLMALEDLNAFLTKNKKSNSSGMKNIALMMIGIGLSLVLIVMAVSQVLKLMDQYPETDKDGVSKLEKVVINIVGFMGVMIIIMEVLSYLNSKFFGKNKGAIKTVGLIVALLIGIILTIKTISKYFYTYDKDTKKYTYNKDFADNFLTPMLFIAGLLVVIGGVLAMLNYTAGGKNGLKGAGFAILALVVALIVIIESINTLYEKMMGMDEHQLIAYGAIILLVFTLFAGLIMGIESINKSIKSNISSKAFFGISLFIVALIAFIAVIGYLIKALVESSGGIGEKIGFVVLTFGAIIVLLLVITGVVGALNDIIDSKYKLEHVSGILKVLCVFLGALIILLAVMAGAAFLVTTSQSTVIAFAAIFGGLVVFGVLLAVFLKVLSSLFNSAAKVKNLKEVIKNLNWFILALAGLIVGMALGAWLISKNENIVSSLGIVFVSLLAVMAAIGLFIYFITTKLKKTEIINATDLMKTLVALILVIGVALAGLSIIAESHMAGMITSSVILALIIGLMTVIVYMLSKIQMVKGSIGIMISMAAAIAIIAYSLYQLSKIDPGRLEHTATVLGVLMAALIIVTVVIAAFASKAPEIGGFILTMAVAIAIFLVALKLALDALAKFLIVLGVFLYGDEFATAMAKVFAAERVSTFSNAISGAADSVTGAMSTMSTAFDSAGTALDNLLLKTDDMTEWFRANPWAAKALFGEEAYEKMKKYDNYITPLDYVGIHVKTKEEREDDYEQFKEDSLRRGWEGIGGKDSQFKDLEDYKEYVMKDKGYLSERQQALNRYEDLIKESMEVSKHGKVYEAQRGRESAMENDGFKDYLEQIRKDQAFLKDSYMAGRQDNALLYSREMERQMRENSKAIVEGTSESINEAATTAGTTAGTSFLEAISSGDISSLVNMESLESLGNLTFGEGGGLVIDTSVLGTDSIPFFNDTELFQEDLLGGLNSNTGLIPAELQNMVGGIGNLSTDMASNSNDLLSAIGSLQGSFDTMATQKRDIGVNIDGTKIAEVISPYVNSNLGQIFVAEAR